MIKRVDRQIAMTGVFKFLSHIVDGEVSAIYFGKFPSDKWVELDDNGEFVPKGNYFEDNYGDTSRDQLFEQVCSDAFMRYDFWYDRERRIISTAYNGFPAGGNKNNIVRFVSEGSKIRWLLYDVAEQNFRFIDTHETIVSMDGRITHDRNCIIGFIIKSWKWMKQRGKKRGMTSTEISTLMWQIAKNRKICVVATRHSDAPDDDYVDVTVRGSRPKHEAFVKALVEYSLPYNVETEPIDPEHPKTTVRRYHVHNNWHPVSELKKELANLQLT